VEDALLQQSYRRNGGATAAAGRRGSAEMNLFEPYLSQWGLEVDGEPVITATSRLLPVRHHGLPAMLKISTHEEAQAGGRVLAWWNGDGAARVLAIDGDALLMERALGNRSLAAMARSGQDDEATPRSSISRVRRIHRPIWYRFPFGSASLSQLPRATAVRS